MLETEENVGSLMNGGDEGGWPVVLSAKNEEPRQGGGGGAWRGDRRETASSPNMMRWKRSLN
jgi:hypothetical protein